MVLLAGCTAPVGYTGRPVGDPIGWEDGYRYNESLSITTADGMNASEREAVVARTMARVERIRHLEFEQRVPVEVITRAQYRERRANRSANRSAALDHWNDQVWEALFLVSERRDVAAARDELFGASVQGFYLPSENKIIIISAADTPTIDRTTLAHELVHALQDQHFTLTAGATTQDGQLAADGLIEGSATYVEHEYEERCGAAWSCIPQPTHTGGGGGTNDDLNLGLFLTIYAPYAEGPSFVRSLTERGGWPAVNSAYEDFPASTEQIIHPRAYPDETPVTVPVPDRSSREWQRFDVSQVYGTMGEAAIYAMFRTNGQVDRAHHALYNYSHPLSTGWGGGRIVPYHNGKAYGYVWKTRWDTTADAKAFLRGYRGVLRAHDATRDGNVYVIPGSDPYADAFRVTRRGRTVVIVNAPTRDQLAAVHASR